MTDFTEKLTRKQEEAIVALFSTRSVEEAARPCKTPVRTLFRWLKEPDFDAAYRTVRAEWESEVTRTLIRRISNLEQKCPARQKDEGPTIGQVMLARHRRLVAAGISTSVDRTGISDHVRRVAEQFLPLLKLPANPADSAAYAYYESQKTIGYD